MWVNEADEDRSVKINVQLGLIVLSKPPSVRRSVGRFLQGHDGRTIHMGVEFETPAETTQKKKKWIMGEE